VGLLDKLRKQSEKVTALSLRPTNALSDGSDLIVHNDLTGMLWIADGPLKNYTEAPPEQYTFDCYGIDIAFTFRTEAEPSAIYTKMPIAQVSNIKSVERPPYFPRYSELTPEQRGVYWHLLGNPYNPNINIGFVFILYYGLERHILSGDYEKAVDVILKLRDVHDNSSFQSYSASAIMLTSMIRNRLDILNKFLESLDKPYKLNISHDILLLCKLLINDPLTSKDIMKFSKIFGFTKTNYIKNYPDLFEKALDLNIQQKFQCSDINVSSFVDKGDFNRAPKEIRILFANVSIETRDLQIPLIAGIPKFQSAMFNLLDITHEQIKAQLAKKRKSGEIHNIEKSTMPKPKSGIIHTFDSAREKELLEVIEKCKRVTDRHFYFIELQNLYYKSRSEDERYLELCIKCCIEDIALLGQLQDEHRREESQSHQLVDATHFLGKIPAFERLAIIYDKQKQFDKAIKICDDAIIYYSKYGMPTESQSFEERKGRLMAKDLKIK